VRALWWLFGTVGIFSVIFLFLIRNETDVYEREKAVSFAFTGAIPLYSLPRGEEERMFSGEYGNAAKWTYYGEILFSTIVWTLLILSLRQKFRR
jgi:hypothetical protein